MILLYLGKNGDMLNYSMEKIQMISTYLFKLIPYLPKKGQLVVELW